VRHQSFINFIYSLVHINTLHQNDIMVQLATSTFDAHVPEILSPLISGATVIMLHPHGNMDFMYLYQILQDKQITCLLAVPTFLNHLCDFIKKKTFNPWITMRNICCVGE
jgi:non-ribosomal peptide synthetase component F